MQMSTLILLVALSGCVPTVEQGVEDIVLPMAEEEVEKCMATDKSDCLINEYEEFKKENE